METDIAGLMREIQIIVSFVNLSSPVCVYAQTCVEVCISSSVRLSVSVTVQVKLQGHTCSAQIDSHSEDSFAFSTTNDVLWIHKVVQQVGKE